MITALGCWECKIDKKLEIKYIAKNVSFWEVFGLLVLTWSDLGLLKQNPNVEVVLMVERCVISWPYLYVDFRNTHTYSILSAIFPGEPGLCGCPLNSHSLFIPELCILLGQA